MGKHTFVTTALLAVLVTTASLANAQGRRHGNNGDGGSRQRIPSRADSGGNQGGSNGGGNRQGAERQTQPRDGGRVQQQPRADNSRGADNNRGNDQQADNGRRQVAPQDRPATQGSAERNQGNRRAEGRNNDGRDGHNDGRPGVNRYATPRTGPAPVYRHGDHRVYVQPRHNYYVYPYPAYRYYGSTRYYGYRYYDPYFAGSFYWSNNSWRAQSYYTGSNWDYDLGKLRLDIDQRDAEVYINGYYAGVIDDFDGVLQGLRLEPGNYQVEVSLPGFAPLQFDVRVTPGRTTTYRGSLLPEP